MLTLYHEKFLVKGVQGGGGGVCATQNREYMYMCGCVKQIISCGTPVVTSLGGPVTFLTCTGTFLIFFTQ